MIKRVGDTVFNAQGQPALVVDREPVTENLTLERGDQYDRSRRYGFINGISPDLRPTYQAVMDRIRETRDPRDRVQLLSEEIGKLADDPKSRQLKKYLNAEMVHIMNSENVQPRIYQLPEQAIR